MIFDTKQYVPLIYRSSRDYEALLKLLDIILTTSKYETDTLINLYIPEQCSEDFLPTLAEHLGYVYNYKDSINENRTIIDYFVKMIRNRGSITGIKLAAALSLNSIANNEEEIALLSELDVFFDYDLGEIIILYPRENTKVRNLLDWVRPVGMLCTSFPADLTNVSSDMAIHAYAEVDTIIFDKYQFGKVDWSEVYNGMVIKVSEDDIPHTWKDVIDYTWDYFLSEEFPWERFLSEGGSSNAITITFDANGGNFSTGIDPVINTYTDNNITALPSTAVSFGINKLIRWQDSTGRKDLLPGETYTVIQRSNYRYIAQWQVLQQHSFLINKSNITQTLNTLSVRPMFIGTFWHVLINYKNNADSTWQETVYHSPTISNENSIYTISNLNYDEYKITIGYDTILNSNDNLLDINLNSFTQSNLYNYAYDIDLSGLNELILDLFQDETIINQYIICNNSYLETFHFPPNIQNLTIPNGLLCNCTKLNTIIFPESSCNFIYKQINGNYISNFLINAGIDNYKIGTFIIPSNITIKFENFDTYIGTNVSLFTNLGCAQTIEINCNVISDSDDDPQITLSLNTNSQYNINNLFLNGNMNLYNINTNNKLNNLFISANCSINNYEGLNNLSSSAHSLLQIITDEYGSTTQIPDNQITDGAVSQIILGDAINHLGEFTLSNLYNILDINIPNNITTIPKTAIQSNSNLQRIYFNDNSNVVIQGFHNLNGLTEIEIPNCSVLDTCFYNCENLTTVNFNNINYPNYETMFVNCNNLTTINSDNSNIYSVKNNLLCNNTSTMLLWVPWGNTNITIPDTITTIGSYSFSGCHYELISPYLLDSSSLTENIIHNYDEVIIPESVITIETNSFTLTNINKLTILNANLDLTNITTSTTINTIKGHINSTAHIFAINRSITFEPIDEIIDNINGLITNDLGQNILD